MFHDDPLDDWLFLRGRAPEPKADAHAQAQAHTALDRLTDFLANPNPKRDMSDVGIGPWGYASVTLSADDLARAQELYLQVVETGGSGNTFVQEGLLNQIAVTCDPASIPFWLALLDLTRPRESFANKRRAFALAALAYLAIRRDEAAAYAALRAMAHHPSPAVRTSAVYYLGRAYIDAKRPIPPNVQDDIATIAVHDSSFGPRFHAREILRATGQPVPIDNPEGAYAFKVKFRWDKRTSRTIELRSEQTLEDLHLAIQDAIDWDNDHLYSFYVNGFEHDRRYEFACPYEKDRRAWTTEAILGELGLVLKHKFLYYFDYGDSHEFEVEVVGIKPTAEPGAYPRVVESKGKSPPQYDWGEDEDEE